MITYESNKQVDFRIQLLLRLYLIAIANIVRSKLVPATYLPQYHPIDKTQYVERA